jgi:hypothetical protein
LQQPAARTIHPTTAPLTAALPGKGYTKLVYCGRPKPWHSQLVGTTTCGGGGGGRAAAESGVQGVRSPLHRTPTRREHDFSQGSPEFKPAAVTQRCRPQARLRPLRRVKVGRGKRWRHGLRLVKQLEAPPGAVQAQDARALRRFCRAREHKRESGRPLRRRGPPLPPTDQGETGRRGGSRLR